MTPEELEEIEFLYGGVPKVLDLIDGIRAALSEAKEMDEELKALLGNDLLVFPCFPVGKGVTL